MIESADPIWTMALAALKPFAIKLGLIPVAGMTSASGNGSKMQSAATLGQLIIAVLGLLVAGVAFQISQYKDVAAAERRLTLLEAQAANTERLAADLHSGEVVVNARITELEKGSALSIQAMKNYQAQMAAEHAAIYARLGGTVSIYNAPQPQPKGKAPDRKWYDHPQ
jgi:cell division protein FtsB